MYASQTFKNEPRPVVNRRKYRPPTEAPIASLQYDRRVHRGNTYAAWAQSTAAEEAHARTTQAILAKREVARRPQKESVFDLGLPDVERAPIDLTAHLVEREVIKTTADEPSQTDRFQPMPPPAPYVTLKTGIDASTQVLDGELFDFNREADPILDIIVNKTLEQALMEVEEESELQAMDEYREEWLARQKHMMKRWEQQVQEERQRAAEMEAVKAAAETRFRECTATMRKVRSACFSRHYLQDLTSNVLAELDEEGWFVSSTLYTVETEILPWLFENATKQVNQRRDIQTVVDGLLSCAGEQICDQQRKALEHRLARERADALRAREELDAVRGNIRIYVDDDNGEKIAVGPVKIESCEDVRAVQKRVYQWLQEHHSAVAEKMPRGIVLCVDDEPIETTAVLFQPNRQISLRGVPEPLEQVPVEEAQE